MASIRSLIGATVVDSLSLWFCSASSMASLRNRLSLISFSTLLLISACSGRVSFNFRLPSRPNNSVTDIHDLLPQYGFPKGIIPDAVKSFTLSPDGSFAVELDRPCYVHFDELVYYDTHIEGKLTKGKVSGVSGIQAKLVLVWLPVTGMDADSKSDSIEFHVGALSKKLPAKQFQTIPTCKKKITTAKGLAAESIFGSFYRPEKHTPLALFKHQPDKDRKSVVLHIYKGGRYILHNLARLL